MSHFQDKALSFQKRINLLNTSTVLSHGFDSSVSAVWPRIPKAARCSGPETGRKPATEGQQLPGFINDTPSAKTNIPLRKFKVH